MNRTNERGARLRSAVFGIIAVLLVSMIISYPDQAFRASLSGLTVWWELVFPALLPFLILSEILLGLGFVHAVGIFLEPLMRLFFRLPGVGGWAVAVSFAAGFPSGAKAAADLRRDGAINARDGDRLLALSHLCNPIFITSVVAVGFLNRPELGLPLVAIHLGSALITGLLIGYVFFRGKPDDAEPDTPPLPPRYSAPPPKRPIAARALSAMASANRKDGRAFGRLLGDAVTASVQSLLAIGGFMIVFSVLIELLSLAGITDLLQWAVQSLLQPLGMPRQLAGGMVTSLFELHLGTYQLSRSGELTVWGAATVSAAIAWGGLSIHAQVKSMTSGTDLRYRPFLLARLLHAFVSVVLVFVCWEPLQRWFGHALPASAAASPAWIPSAASDRWLAWPQWLASMQWLGAAFLGAVTLSAAISALRRFVVPARRQ